VVKDQDRAEAKQLLVVHMAAAAEDQEPAMEAALADEVLYVLSGEQVDHFLSPM
jgi:hypothetical protein